MAAPRGLASKWAVITALGLFVAHFLVWAYVDWRNVAYDQGDLEGLLWWLGAFLILPALAAIILISSAMVRWINRLGE